jgi:hypothetical protein
MFSWHTVLLSLWSFSCISPLFANDVILRLSPSVNAPIIAKIDDQAPLMKTARPVLESTQARQGWQWLEYTTTLDGYILTKQLSKNFEATPNSLVRLEPNNQAQVLTAIQPGDLFEIKASNDTWTTIRIRKAVPVYFNAMQLPIYTAAQVPAPSYTATQVPTSSYSEATATAIPQRITVDPNKKVANIPTNRLKPENVKWLPTQRGIQRAATVNQPVLVPRDSASYQPVTIQSEAQPILQTPIQRETPTSIVVYNSEQQASELPQRPAVQANSQLRTLNGTLIREISNTGPRFPIRLISQSGQQRAYIDMSHIFVSDLRPYLNKPVQIIGEVMPNVAGSQDLIIQARTIRLTE